MSQFWEISSATDAAEELQLRAGLEGGVLYQSPDYPEAAFVRMTTGWFENTLVRFVTDARGDGGHVYYKERYYPTDSGCEITGRFPVI